jgi:hypothetical protein
VVLAELEEGGDDLAAAQVKLEGAAAAPALRRHFRGIVRPALTRFTFGALSTGAEKPEKA